MLTKSAMDELIDSKHPAYRYDAAFGEFRILISKLNFQHFFRSNSAIKVGRRMRSGIFISRWHESINKSNEAVG